MLYDIYTAAGGHDKGVEEVFSGIQVTNGQLDIAFSSAINGGVNNAKVDAIIVQAE